MIKVYIASKIKYAKRFQALRTHWRSWNIDIHCRWLDQAHIEEGREPSPEEFSIFWLVDEEDVKECQALIVYGEPGDELRGGLIETGIAIANNKLVIICGDCASFGSWRHHPAVVKTSTIEFAKELILIRFRT